jgi:restriction system protein
MNEINLPKFDEFLAPILRYASDNKEHELSKTIEKMSMLFILTEEQQNLLIPNGRKTHIYDRIAWAITYLAQTGPLVSIGRSKYMISKKGKEEAKIIPEKIFHKYLEKFKSYVRFKELKCNKEQNKTNDKRLTKAVLTIDEEIDIKLMAKSG